MKISTKTIWIIIVCALLCLVIIPLVINVLFKIDLGICVLQSEWDAGDALAFYGSVLSVLLTVIGVFLTIRYENNKAKKEDSIKYKPILELDGINLNEKCGYREVGLGYGISYSNDNPNKEQILKRFSENLCGKRPKYQLYFKNVGRGETFNARLESFKIKSLNWTDISNMVSNYSTPQYIGEIIADGYLGVYVYLPDYLLLPKDTSNINYFDLCTELTITYSDMFDRMKYKSVLYIHHKITVTGIEELTPDVYDDNYHYVKVKYEPYDPMPSKMIFSKKKGEYVHEHEYIIE